MEEKIKVQYTQLAHRFCKMTWTHKIQEKQGDIYMAKARRLKTKMAVFTVATTTSAVMVCLSQIGACIGCDWFEEVITALLSAFSAYFVLRYKDEPYEAKAKENKAYAAQCRKMRNQYESLMTDIKSRAITNPEVIAHKRDELERSEDILFSGEIAPHTSKEALKMAEIALKKFRESKTEEEELNELLPDYLQIE